jgi:hypothetical protein
MADVTPSLFIDCLIVGHAITWHHRELVAGGSPNRPPSTMPLKSTLCHTAPASPNCCALRQLIHDLTGRLIRQIHYFVDFRF